MLQCSFFFFFQAEDGIRDYKVTGVQTCALPIVIVGYLLQIAAELKTAGSAEAAALRRRTSRLIRTLKPETLQRLVGMGGDFAQRRQFVSDAAEGMAVDAVLDILKAAAETSHATISHSLLRLLSKLAVHAEAGAAPPPPPGGRGAARAEHPALG